MSTELATTQQPAKAPLRSGGSVAAIVPADAEQAFRMAQMIHKSGMAPSDMRDPEKIVAAIFHGLEVGMKPMQAVQSIAVVNGRPVVWGDAALGLVQGSGLLEDITETVEGEGDDMVATCEVKRIGRTHPTRQTFSVADAKAANLWGKNGPWKQYPRRMLQMRARGFAIRDAFPDVLKGLSVREEVQDYRTTESMRDITPTSAAELTQEILTTAKAAQAQQEPPPAEAEEITPGPSQDAAQPQETAAEEIAAADQPELIPAEPEPQSVADLPEEQRDLVMELQQKAGAFERRSALSGWFGGECKEAMDKAGLHQVGRNAVAHVVREKQARLQEVGK